MDITSLCRCCLLCPPDQDMKSPQICSGKSEVYWDMLKECFEIHLSLESHIGQCGICEPCIQRLRDACNFKQQVQQCQRVLTEFVLKGNVKDEVPNVKKEAPETYDCDDDAGFLDLDNLKEEEDDKSLAEFLGLKDITIKKKKSASNKRNLSLITIENDYEPKSYIKKSRISSKQVKLKVITGKIDFTNFELSINDTKAFQQNLQTIIKNSNCTPFSTKTVHGFTCAYCKNVYQDIQELRAHTQNEHKNDQIVTKKLDKNSLSIKIDITDLTCNICKERLNLIADLKSHLMNKHDVKFHLDVYDYILEFKFVNSDVLNCALCNSSYETFKMLLQHMNGHYRNFICDECDLGFLNRHKLMNHKKIHEVGTFKCSSCDKVFTTRVRRATHEKYTHNDSARYTTNCPHCEKTFNSYYQRNRHMYTEHNTVAATYKCTICDKSFILKSKLTAHIKKVHLMERDHICPVCGQGFFVKKCLEDHMIKHNGERVYKCTVCSKAYARKKTLREHMRIHNNDRRFKCGVCEMAFVQKCSLKSHMLSNHGVTLDSYEKRKSENGSVEVT